MTRAAEISESTSPFPPRFWWLKRIFAVSLILLLMLSTLRLWWGHDARRRLNAEIAAIRAGGEPILPEEFNSTHVPDAENFVFYVNKAIAAIDPNADPPAATAMQYNSYPPYPPQWYTQAQKSVAGNRTALQLLRQARQHPKVDWNVKFTKPVNSNFQFRLNDQRHLANILGDAALYEHLQGNDAEAMEELHDLLACADTVDQHPVLVAHLVAIGISDLAMHRLHVISPAMNLADHPAANAGMPARREQVRAIIALLLDPAFCGNLHRTMQAERMFNMDLCDECTRACFLLRPMYELDSISLMRGIGRMVSAATKPSVAEVANALGPAPKISTNPQSPTNMLTGAFLFGGDQLMRMEFHQRTQRRMLAVCLAARMYQIDHNGDWPPNLEALAPKYLAAVPVDPYSRQGAPLKYLLARNGQRPVVYSVGGNGRDDTPNESVLPAEPVYESIHARDIWRDMSRFAPPATQPATQE